MNTEKIKAAANFMIKTGSTVRRTANVFGISKTTLHKYLRKRLKNISPELYEDVKKVLEKNKAERHLRGGKATAEKRKEMKGN